ncbi:MAG: HAD-IC family P-type ATPase [Fuerstiella sp.]|nr:HAD-IC family P-type ATPase [Fuerstiella sp.]
MSGADSSYAGTSATARRRQCSGIGSPVKCHENVMNSSAQNTNRSPARDHLPPFHEDDWAALTAQAVEERLQTSTLAGLSDHQIEERQRTCGKNTIAQTGRTTWAGVLGRQFVDALIWILIAAAALSAAIGEITDAVTILAIVALNGILGFIQEWKAERAVEALRQMLSPQCRVRRNRAVVTINAEQLVPGDIVLLETGDRLPADVRLLEATNLRVDESALTGESDSVAKGIVPVNTEAALANQSCMAWMGTAITNGRGLGAVAATGGHTQFGRIASLTGEIVTERTPLQRKLGRQLGIWAIGVSVMVVLAGIVRGKAVVEMFMTGISLAVAVVPEGLPAVVTITLALGIRAMIKRRALLRRLQAAEAVGSATVICTDKTGTLTQNQMTVQTIWLPGRDEIDVTGVGYDPAGHFEFDGNVVDYHTDEALVALLESGMLCNHARIERDQSTWHESGEPTEAALIVAACKAWIDPNSSVPSVAEFSFNSARKRMTVVTKSNDGLTAHVKGAPEVILNRSQNAGLGHHQRPLDDAEQQRIIDICNSMADRGLRTLAIARREIPSDLTLDADSIEQQLTLLGIVGIIDPPRPEVPEAVRRAITAGIRLVMITGDAARTALAIAQRVGLPSDQAVEGSELAAMSDSDLRAALNNNAVFARTEPEHKLRIVKLLQQDGQVVGMTGDGVNDAPALKKADIGIAMGQRGTDVAKGAADIVLTDDNFSSIIDAVEEGRRQYDNIQKFVRYMLSSNTGEAVAIFSNILIGGPLILLPVQILWMNLITDGLTALALGLESAETDVMRRPPRDPSIPILDRKAIGMIVGLGAYVGIATLWLFQHVLDTGGASSAALAQTMAFNGIIVIEWFNVMNFRTLRTPVTVVGLLTNRWMLVAIALTAILQICALYVPFLQNALHTVPLNLPQWGLIAVVALPIFVACELIKWWKCR